MSADDVERAFREEHGRAVAVLVRAFGDLDVAEEAVQDAFAEAVRRWPVDGPPPSPAGWIITTARNRAIDRLRREGARPGKHAQAALLSGPVEAEPAIGDDRLRLLFTCCHPALGMAARVALTLRMVGGLSTADVYRECDRLRRAGGGSDLAADLPAPGADAALVAALREGSAAGLASALSNDLQAASVALRPALADTLATGLTAGALAALVSGSGPTCAFLAPSAGAATTLAAAFPAAYPALSPAPGATLL